MLYDPAFGMAAGPLVAAPPVYAAPFAAAPFAAPIMPPVAAPLPAFDVASTVSGSLREEEDYTFWRNSRAKVPFLLLILAIFTTLILLTMWQARSDISYLRAGIPREIEDFTSSTQREAGVKKYRRNIRFADATTGIIVVLLIGLVYIWPLLPVMRSKLNFLLALLLFLNGILAVVVFALDINSERAAHTCVTNSHYTNSCSQLEDIESAITVFDAFYVAFLFVAAYCVFVFSRTGDWTKSHDPQLISFAAGPGELQPGMYPNGVSYVRKWVTFLALLGVLVFAILILVFTIIVQQGRNTYEARDINNRPVDGSGNLTLPGWPLKNTKLRYAVCSLVILTVLINLIPLTSRVIAYIFFVLYLGYAVIAFVTFAVDINAVSNAHNLTCLPHKQCTYHSFNATITIDFIGAVALLVFIVVEYFVVRRAKRAAPVTVTY